MHKENIATEDATGVFLSSPLPFPPLSWWQTAIRCSSVLLDAHERYEKMSLRNRYYITGPQGKQLMSIPLKNGRNQRLPTGKVIADPHTDWQTRHWRTIQSFYGRAPFFEFFAEDIQSLFESNGSEINLFEWCFSGIRLIASLLQLDINIERTNKFELSYESGINDYRFKSGGGILFNAGITYHQVFQDRTGFIPNCSVLDILFCNGGQAKALLSFEGEK